MNLHLKYKAFTLAEMMVVLLVLSIVLAATMPIITKRSKPSITDQMNLPPGIIAPFAGNTIPPGWLLCDGQSTANYPGLAAVVGPNVPDLRGEFIRGLDNGRGVDNGRALGSSQGDAFKAHTHTIRTYWDGHYSYSKANQAGDGGSTDGVPASTMNTSSAGGGATETRPRNIALNYIIKW